MAMTRNQQKAMFAKINARFVSTPSHGYLVVKNSDINKVNPSISDFSPRTKTVTYLEEDADANNFLRKAKAKKIKLKINYFKTENNNFPFDRIKQVR